MPTSAVGDRGSRAEVLVVENTLGAGAGRAKVLFFWKGLMCCGC